MEIQILDVRYHLEVLNFDKKSTIVFLHGFTGSTKTWRGIEKALPEYKIVLIDLLGHGLTDSPEDSARYTMELQIRDLNLLFGQLGLENFALAGYSMGGRTALAYACTYPQQIEALILESASPGLKSADERLDRQQRDSELALKILANGITSFVDKWENIPLFDTQKRLPETVKQTIRAERLHQNPLGLANSLIGMGTGTQKSYWSQVKQLNLPVLLVTGAMDPKFMAIAEEMKQALPKVQHGVIEAGHAIHVEKPAEFATMVKEYLSSNYRGGKS
ncbi:2-succinyl-6-hydroxy-2,4-cyclohexadiene-1-carboxylate synthase [Planococcus shenhongbingii]|uniref:Putative 2-succinyl-6-hydroxy-2,4-cyclohexadiene-1-carboxylate synthase n=1 Tax=Planococcus shenhongbingii TaxID=3058398 RepID=A0ABT8NDW3_9BACL|nr:MULTISPECIES: 2-succinyl-6-hydroxy-2,4-cyclohexadiene-1-carboxylate synthase [unclassified Planococcus (in: firmicutes)]MDN7246087.1 2-succinyl-6-hydroxy-2,4-cyclohexadiene-1-carboxylate synthase [Planococcus sp. N017]WKA59785.1 2-succinyl-6-hydroxy-2,4-cyclohexadiene-1-carboxylate synthase [Planococcus sp. N016]